MFRSGREIVVNNDGLGLPWPSMDVEQMAGLHEALGIVLARRNSLSDEQRQKEDEFPYALQSWLEENPDGDIDSFFAAY